MPLAETLCVSKGPKYCGGHGHTSLGPCPPRPWEGDFALKAAAHSGPQTSPSHDRASCSATRDVQRFSSETLQQHTRVVVPSTAQPSGVGQRSSNGRMLGLVQDQLSRKLYYAGQHQQRKLESTMQAGCVTERFGPSVVSACQYG